MFKSHNLDIQVLTGQQHFPVSQQFNVVIIPHQRQQQCYSLSSTNHMYWANYSILNLNFLTLHFCMEINRDTWYWWKWKSCVPLLFWKSWNMICTTLLLNNVCCISHNMDSCIWNLQLEVCSTCQIMYWTVAISSFEQWSASVVTESTIVSSAVIHSVLLPH